MYSVLLSFIILLAQFSATIAQVEVSSTNAAASQYLEITIEDELTAEKRQAIIESLYSNNAQAVKPDFQSIVEAFSNPIPVTEIQNELNGGEAPDVPDPSEPDICRDETCYLFARNVQDLSVIRRLDEPFRSRALMDGGQDFVFVDPLSDVGRAFGASAMQFPTNSGTSTDHAVSAVAQFAVPIDIDTFMEVAGVAEDLRCEADDSCSGGVPAAIGLPGLLRPQAGLTSGVVVTLAALQRDFDEFGSSIQVFEIEGELTQEQQDLLESAGISARPVPERSIVQQDIPDGAVIQTTASDSCDPSKAQDWPFSTAGIKEKITYNLSVLDAAGVRDLRPANIVIVDSGLPEGLAEHTEFSRFLSASSREVLRQDRYWRTTGEQTPTCRGKAINGTTRFGRLLAADSNIRCAATEKLGGLIPPPLQNADDRYIPDHGGLVATLAVGGPSVIGDIPELGDILKLRFAKVMKLENGRIVSTPADVKRAFEYASQEGFHIVNASLRVSNSGTDALSPGIAQLEGKGLTIAAAGNSAARLVAGSRTFPAQFASVSGDNDSLIIVGGLERGGPEGSSPSFWSESSYSERLVDIAAPSKDILSLNGDGDLACFSGTSVAAPQVSFAAAMLHTYGYQGPAEIRRRILATATISGAISNRVRDGRVLDLASAIDVFADLVWLDGDPKPIRARLRPALDDDERLSFKLCEAEGSSLESVGGWIDPGRVHLWLKQENNLEAVIWHDEENGNISRVSNTCKVPNSSITLDYFDGPQNETISLDRVDRIVPSRLRHGLDTAFISR